MPYNPLHRLSPRYPPGPTNTQIQPSIWHHIINNIILIHGHQTEHNFTNDKLYWNTKMKQYEQVHNEHQQMLSINPLKLIWIQ